MPPLRNLGQPFGAPSRIFNIPAPTGAAQGAFANQQALQSATDILTNAFLQKRQQDLQQQDIQNFGRFNQQQAQLGQAEAGLAFARQDPSAIPQGQLPPGLEQGFPAFVPQPAPLSQAFKNTAAQGILQRAFGDPFGLQQAQAGLAQAQTVKALRPPATKPLLPSQQISQKKLDEINRLQAKADAGTITKPEQAKLDKMLVGTPLVEIGLGKPAAAAERTAIAETRASIDALDNLKSLFDNAQTKVGLIPGRIEPIKGLFGMTTDEQESLMAATSAFKNKIIKEITGAQMSEVEAKRIMKQIPDITDPPARWKAKWQQSKRNLQFIQKRRTEVLRQSGLRVPEGTTEIDITQTGVDQTNIDSIGTKFGF